LTVWQRPPQFFLSPGFFIAKTQQQRFKLIKCLLLIRSDRLEDDTGAAIQIGSKHFQQAGGREILFASPNCDCALEPDHAPDKQRRGSRVQPELRSLPSDVRNFSYSQPDRLNPNHSPLHTAAIPTRVAS
jgi:hypothetical protein